MTGKTEHLTGADGLRGLACLIVMLVHASVFNDPTLGPFLAGCGKIGVWLFFTLSAYLLTVRLTSTGFAPPALFDYGVGRALRIYPLFLVAACAHFTVGLAIITPGDLFATSLLLAGPVHFWTIPVEMGFYVMLPLIVWSLLWFQRRRGDAAMIGAIVVAVGVHQAIWPYWNTPENSIALIWYLPTFLFGVSAALLRHRSLPHPSWYAVIVLAIAAGIALSMPLTQYHLFGVLPSRYLMDKQVFFGLAYAVVIWCVVARHTVITAVLTSRPIVLMGLASYSTYLFHWLIMRELLTVVPGGPTVPALLVAAAFLFGWLMHLAAERPLARLRNSLSVGSPLRRHSLAGAFPAKSLSSVPRPSSSTAH